MEWFRPTSVRQLAGMVAVMTVALAVTTLAVGALEGALRIPDASATYLLAVVSIAVAFGTSAAVALPSALPKAAWTAAMLSKVSVAIR